MLYEKDLATLEVGEVIGKIRSHEMFLMGEVDPPNAKKDLALKAKSDHKSKKKTSARLPHQAQVMMKLVKIQVMRMVMLSLHFS